MQQLSEVLWLSGSTALKEFDYPLLKRLSQHCVIAQWEYCQTQDEPLCLEGALELLQGYLKDNCPVHLVGHGISGLLALLYARRYPERVQSLTLLSVGVYPAVDWQAHYYAQLQMLPCSREMLLMQTVQNLLGRQCQSMQRRLMRVLDTDLQTSLSPHTLYQRTSFLPGGVSVPLLVCGSQDDVVVDPNAQQGWWPWMKEGDRLWQSAQGGHFFHYFYPHQVAEQILAFWQAVHPDEMVERYTLTT